MHLDFVHVPPQFLTSPSGFHEALCFLESRLPFCRHQHSFQKGDSILTLITFTMRSLRRHRENHHCSLLSLTPITFDFNTFSCYGGSYFATIAVVFYIFRRPLNFVGLSMPTESMILLTGVIAYCSEYCSSSELSSAFIKTTPEGAAVVYINTQFQLLYNTLF
jgi:hypothetical protein